MGGGFPIRRSSVEIISSFIFFDHLFHFIGEHYSVPHSHPYKRLHVHLACLLVEMLCIIALASTRLRHYARSDRFINSGFAGSISIRAEVLIYRQRVLALVSVSVG